MTVPHSTLIRLRGTGKPMGDSLQARASMRWDPAKTALVVVDMQYFDAHPDWGEGRTAHTLGVDSFFQEYYEQVSAALPKIGNLLAAFREKRMEVIHLRVAELTRDSRDVGRKQLVRGLTVPVGSREADFLEAVAPEGDELVISKSSSGVFPVTNFDRILRNLGVTTLVFTGTSTGGCVESAVLDAADLGYEVVVVADACADATLADHYHALERMNQGLVRVLESRVVLAELAPLPPLDTSARSGLSRVVAFTPKTATPSADPAANPYVLIFGEPVEPRVDRDATALLLVDLQLWTCDPSTIPSNAEVSPELAAYYARAQTAVENSVALLNAARATGIRVIHVRTAGRLRDAADLSPHLRSMGISFGDKDPRADFVPSIRPEAGEPVLTKPGFGAFTGTGLDELLRNAGVESIVVAGASFAGAIGASVRSAGDRGFDVLVVADACALGDESDQADLWGMSGGTINARSTAEVLALITRAK